MHRSAFQRNSKEYGDNLIIKCFQNNKLNQEKLVPELSQLLQGI